MLSPLTNTLIKIFAKGFFRLNSGLLMFFFVILVSYCFFMNTVGDVKLISPEQLTFYHFIIVITFISSPTMTLAIFLVWLIYTIKSWLYVIGQLSIPNHQFLFYSYTSANKIKQFKSWFCVQLVIYIPVIGYWLFASVFGIIFHHYVLPVVILIYILILTSISAFLYVLFVNRLIDGNKQSYLIQMSNKWHKPYFSLYIYHIFDKMKLTYIITKILSLLAIIGLSYFFADVQQDLQVAGIVILTVITAHSILIYQEHRFVETYMSFSRNLPYSRGRLFMNFTAVYFLLILPESIWLLTKFNPAMAVGVLLYGLSIALLFRSLLYWFGLNMFKYLQWVFGLYILLFLIIMFKLLWLLIPLNLLISFTVFYINYYNQKLDIKS